MLSSASEVMEDIQCTLPVLEYIALFGVVWITCVCIIIACKVYVCINIYS